MSFKNSIVGEDEAVFRLPFTIPRTKPTPIPTPNIFDEPFVCFKINAEWASHVIGVLDALDQPDTWIGTEEQIFAARQQIREAILVLSGECEMCCDETNVLMQMLVDQTVINNANQYQNTYNDYIANNQSIQILNEQSYDGNPLSISPNLGTNFNSNPNGDDALCAAIKAYIDTMVYVYGMQAALLTGVASVITGIGLALAPVTLGATLIGVGIATAIAASNALWSSVISDPAAQRDIACCMFDSLKDQPISLATFQASLTGCTTDGTYESNTGFLAAQINATNQLEENYIAFMRALGDAQGSGNEQDCVCDCDDEAIIVSHGAFTSTITPVGQCHYRIEQLIPNEGGAYFMGFKDELGRCLLVELSELPEYPSVGVGVNTTMVDCDDVETNFVGGFAPTELKSVYYNGGGDLHRDHYKITLAV
jgi:hypothetical protein